MRRLIWPDYIRRGLSESGETKNWIGKGRAMKRTVITSSQTGILERRDVSIILSAVLFIINFLLFYFIWLYAFPGMTGIIRIAFCWLGAYSLTWLMTYMTKGVSRLILTLIMIAVQFLVFHYKP